MDAGEKRRLAYLDAMGIQAWSLRLGPPWFEGAEENGAALAGEAFGSGQEPSRRSGLQPAIEDSRRSGLQPAIEDSLRSELQPAIEAGRGLKPAPTTPDNSLEATPCGWDELQAKVANCAACPLHMTRTQTVFGVGDRFADWMVIGEAPGEQEDLQGEPFVGRAGLLLNEMLRAIGLGREQVYIANILKCRPPKNRDPEPEEAAACEGFLKRQLALVKPKIILAVGRIAAQNLLKTAIPIGKLRGGVHDYQGVPLVVTYHPAYLLRAPLEKRRAFEDLRLALRTSRQTR